MLIRVCETQSAGFNTLHLLVREKTKNKQPYSAGCYLLKLGISQSCVLLMGGDTPNRVFRTVIYPGKDKEGDVTRSCYMDGATARLSHGSDI